jgi:hypothetical protein
MHNVAAIHVEVDEGIGHVSERFQVFDKDDVSCQRCSYKGGRGRKDICLTDSKGALHVEAGIMWLITLYKDEFCHYMVGSGNALQPHLMPLHPGITSPTSRSAQLFVHHSRRRYSEWPSLEVRPHDLSMNCGLTSVIARNRSSTTWSPSFSPISLISFSFSSVSLFASSCALSFPLPCCFLISACSIAVLIHSSSTHVVLVCLEF